MIRPLSLFLCLFLISSLAYSGVPKEKHPLEIPLVVDLDYSQSGSKIVDSSEIPKAWIVENYDNSEKNPEKVAESYLKEKWESFGFDYTPKEFVFHSKRETPGGYHIRFQQQIENVPVYEGRIVVTLDKNNRVRFVSNGYKNISADYTPEYSISRENALSISQNYLNIISTAYEPKIEKFILSNNSIHSTYRIYLKGAEGYVENWEVFVDAVSGEIIAARDNNIYGTGTVFDPDPIARNRTIYGETGYIDNGDADSDSLTTSLVTRDLGELEYTDGLYYLRNEYAQIVDGDAPYSGLFGRETDDFSCTRSDTIFEAVNCFYSISQSMRYVNDTLGYNVWPLEYDGPPKFDPDGAQGGATCFYDRDFGTICFGRPSDAVDAAEDQALILHELMHGLHDWITENGITNNEGLSEGCADYWAQSYLRSFGYFTPDDQQYDWFDLWGLKPYYGDQYMRVTNYSGHYPDDLVGEEHEDGQMWSSSLMTLYDNFGREASDKLLLETLSMLDASANQQTAALAYFQADILLYDGAHTSAILEEFYDRGYLSDVIFANFSSDVRFGEPPLEVQFYDHSASLDGPIISWVWDLENDGEVDSYEQNPVFTFLETGSYDVSLTVSDGENTQTIIIEKYISVNTGILVYNFAMNGVDYSGEYIADFYRDRVENEILLTDVFPSTLLGFDVVFLCYGSFDQNFANGGYPTVDDIEALVNYLESGGKVYIEGSQPFYLYRINQENSVYNSILNALGIRLSTMEIGIRDFLPISGAEGSVFDDLVFNGTNQINHWGMEVYPYLESGIPLLSDTEEVAVAVQNENVLGGRSICSAYVISQLQDSGNSTREEALTRISEYFGIELSSEADERLHIPEDFVISRSYPNPFNSSTTFSYTLNEKGHVSVEVFNVLGQKIVSLENEDKIAGTYRITWKGVDSNGKNVSSGTYILNTSVECWNGKLFSNNQRISLIK